MDERQQKGLMIAATANIAKKGAMWVVPSQSGFGRYGVTIEGESRACTCPDFELRNLPCKHIIAVQYVLFREVTTETKPDGTVTTVTTETSAVRLTYAQDWPAYNAAQCSEKELFCHLLRDLCANVPQPTQEMGRPRIPVSDALFSACFKVYSGSSSRRFMSDLRQAKTNGQIDRAWHFNTVLKVIEDEAITPTLYALVTESALPLKAVESAFAVDSTGFGTNCFYRHFSNKYGNDLRRKDYIKLHALVGTKTNVIAEALITDRDAHDSPMLKPLLEKGVKDFDIAELSADKGYDSRKNVALAASLGVEPYIAFRSNAKEVTSRGATSAAWSKLFHLYHYRKEEFLSHYHKRSNVECTFSMMKRVLGETLRSKGMVAQTNELLLKVIAHNIRCLVHSIFELGIEVPGMSACTQSAIAAHNVGAI
jgi:transposase